jgi:hypothetical protein
LFIHVVINCKIMNKEAIQLKIDKNRDLINRALNTDLDLTLLAKIVTDLKKKNDVLIEKLNE